MAKNEKIGKPTEDVRKLGEKAESVIGKIPQNMRKLLVVSLIALIIFFSIISYLFFKHSSSLSSINELEYRRISRCLDGRRWIASEYELGELREFVFHDATGIASTGFSKESIFLFLEGNSYSISISFSFDCGKIIANGYESLSLFYATSEKKVGEAIVLETKGRTVVLYPEK